MADTDTLPLTEEALAKMEPAFREVGNVFEVTGPDNTLAHLHAQARAAIRERDRAEKAEAELRGLRSARSLKADWLLDELLKAAEIELRGDVRALLKARIEKALNPELPL